MHFLRKNKKYRIPDQNPFVINCIDFELRLFQIKYVQIMNLYRNPGSNFI